MLLRPLSITSLSIYWPSFCQYPSNSLASFIHLPHANTFDLTLHFLIILVTLLSSHFLILVHYYLALYIEINILKVA